MKLKFQKGTVDAVYTAPGLVSDPFRLKPTGAAFVRPRL